MRSFDTINLFGAGGHAKVVMDIIKAQGNKVGYIYDDNPGSGELNGKRVVRAADATIESPLIISIGSCKVRKLMAERYSTLGFATALHPESIISESATIGEGTVVMPGAIMNAGAEVGRHCIINTKSSVDHDCRIGDYAHIAPGATLSGDVEIGECTWVGVGACVRQGVKIGRNCMIGAGSVVVKDIPDNVVAFGNPCKVVRSNG